MSNIVLVEGFGSVVMEALQAFSLLLVLLFVFQFTFLRLSRTAFLKLLLGLGIAFAGLVLFLQGVKAGFLPAGDEMGKALGDMDASWAIIPIGFILGFTAIIAEPAVRILGSEVEDVSSGYIKSSVIVYTLSVGVAAFVALGMARMVYGIPLFYLLVPGYLLALLLLPFSRPDFTSIAFDAGGVATGPMTVTFILALTVGAASTVKGRDPVIDGFGLIALVALAPILFVLVLGLIYRWKE
ncbi:MAG: DUF1538 domain-containing protein [Actinomycetota bacterium]|nr:DUF1538 domain-containing protein [Actinomycetota bacterium]MDD5666214.1 DUF1538 domain-containing protein [Actinomycetota bacterium]